MEYIYEQHDTNTELYLNVSRELWINIYTFLCSNRAQLKVQINKLLLNRIINKPFTFSYTWIALNSPSQRHVDGVLVCLCAVRSSIVSSGCRARDSECIKLEEHLLARHLTGIIPYQNERWNEQKSRVIHSKFNGSFNYNEQTHTLHGFECASNA